MTSGGDSRSGSGPDHPIGRLLAMVYRQIDLEKPEALFWQPFWVDLLAESLDQFYPSVDTGFRFCDRRYRDMMHRALDQARVHGQQQIAEHGPPGDIDSCLDWWLSCVDQAYQTLLLDDEFSRLYGQCLNRLLCADSAGRDLS